MQLVGRWPALCGPVAAAYGRILEGEICRQKGLAARLFKILITELYIELPVFTGLKGFRIWLGRFCSLLRSGPSYFVATGLTLSTDKYIWYSQNTV